MKKILILVSTIILFLGTTLPSFGQSDDSLVVLHTNQGKIVIEFFPEDAPNHVKNFISLAESGYYDNTLFHRIIKNFMIQGGDPKTKPDSGSPETEWGTGGPNQLLDAEFNTIKHNRGMVSMARAADPNSAGSQFFIVHKDSNFLDEQYTVFGRIVTQESFDTLDKIASEATETVTINGISTENIPIDREQARITNVEVLPRSQIPDLLDLEDPERTGSSEVNFTGNQLYESEELGVRFSAPAGWLLQEPPNSEEGTPNVIAVGPKAGVTPPIISLTITEHKGDTLDDYVQKQSESLQPSIDAGVLEIISQEKKEISGKQAFVTNAIGFYEQDGIPFEVQFNQAAFVIGDKYYVFAYSNDKNYFDGQLQLFVDSINSFELTQLNTPEPGNDGGGCLIATATYSSEMAPQVQLLREIRDGKVMNTESGAAFMAGFNQVYYLFSPTIADWERENPAFKEMVRVGIAPMLATLAIMQNADSESEVLGYGMAVIMMNVGMYVMAPAIVISKLRKISH